MRIFDTSCGNIVYNRNMDIEQLKGIEVDLIIAIEASRVKAKELTRQLINIRQRINYAKSREGQAPKGEAFAMFGKKVQDLSPDELREYNKYMQKNSRKRSKESNKN